METPRARAVAHGALSSRQKSRAVLRLLAGESLEALAEELRVPADRLQDWQDRFVEAGRASLTHRSDYISFLLRTRRERALQWVGIALGMLAVMWLITRIFASTQGGVNQ